MEDFMHKDLFLDILRVDSTSGRERAFAEMLKVRLVEFFGGRCEVEEYEVGDGTLNLLFKWGEPKVVLCTHLDTVPPYIAPSEAYVHEGDILPDGAAAAGDGVMFCGRGTCDAKGQLFAMAETCKTLSDKGLTGFGMLLLSGEETGSFGAKAWNRDCRPFDTVVVCEPTDNCMVSASKGTKSFAVKINGTPCHSGYPELGHSAVTAFAEFMDILRAERFPEDPVLGATTWNIGKLHSDNPQNILSPELTFRVYFRTTFASDLYVQEFMKSLASRRLNGCVLEIEAFGGDSPAGYMTVEGIPVKTVAFGSDAPQLKKFPNRALCGAGTIKVAHTEKEYVLLSDLETAVAQYIRIIEQTLAQ